MNKKAKGREEIHLEKNVVIRPRQPWSQVVQDFLEYMDEKGVGFLPKALGFDNEGHERLSKTTFRK